MKHDLLTRQAYAVDASIFEIMPTGVVVAKNKRDIQDHVIRAKAQGLSVVARGGGTGIAGGALTNGVVIDCAQHLDTILETNWDDGWVRCEPGVVLDKLNRHLASRGFRFGPDLSTSNRATVGGMVSNNSSGAHSLLFGRTSDNVISCEMVMHDGSLQTFGPLSDHAFTSKVKSNSLYREINRIMTHYRDAIAVDFPKIKRRASGYNLDCGNNLAKLISGAEGTLGVITEVTLKIVPMIGESALFLLPFTSLQESFEAVPQLLTLRPYALEVVDKTVIELGRMSTTMRGKLGWLQGDPGALLIVEGPPDLLDNPILDKGVQEDIWAMRKAGLGLLLSRRTHSKAIAFIEDLAVPPDHLSGFIAPLQEILQRHNTTAGIYGHAGEGCLHVRPFIDLRDEQDKLSAIMEEVTHLVKRFHGVMSGEHGDGILRASSNEIIFGKTVCQAFREVKQAFDPQEIFSPGQIVGSPLPLDKIRKGEVLQVDTLLPFDQGLGFAVNMCNGNGACRKEGGLMCPSFDAEHNEYHTTRARAQGLRGVINGTIPFDTLWTKEFYDLLDWCVECKGCKNECPSNVDMAKMKTEFLYHYGEENGFSIRSRIFGYSPKLSRLPTPPAFVLRRLGVTDQRPLPKKAKRRFSQSRLDRGVGNPVVLFNDTFNEYYTPHIGLSAHAVLTKLGYSVITPKYRCCGRTLLSKGFIPAAKRYAKRVVDLLLPFAQGGIPIIGLEPSCILTIKDDYPDLVGANVVSERCTTLEELLSGVDLPPTRPHMHIHCHQQSLVGREKTADALRSLQPQLLPAGCCGMAGSFGYEAEHYDFSLKIGQRHIFPAVQAIKPGEPLIANGFSCRCQIEHACNTRPLHLAEYLSQVV